MVCEKIVEVVVKKVVNTVLLKAAFQACPGEKGGLKGC